MYLINENQSLALRQKGLSLAIFSNELPFWSTVEHIRFTKSKFWIKVQTLCRTNEWALHWIMATCCSSMKRRVGESHLVLPFPFARHRYILLPYFSVWFGLAGLEDYLVRTLGKRTQFFLILLCLSRGTPAMSGSLTWVPPCVSLPQICFPWHGRKVIS